MFEAIVALIGAIIGVVGGVAKSGHEKFLTKSAEYEANIDFERQKDLSLYGIYSSQQRTRNMIIVGGVLLVIGLAFVLVYQKKK